jgi:hypothetical protein
MQNFYLYFFIRQIIILSIFLSNIDALYKIFIMLTIDEFGGHIPFHKYKLELQSNDKLIIMDTIGSMFTYVQVLVLLIENKLLINNYEILVGVLLIHILSVLNHLRNKAIGGKNDFIFPDLFKPAIILAFIFS